MKRNVYKALFPITLVIVFFLFNMLEGYFRSRTNWMEYDGESYLFLNLCTIVSIMLLSYYVCFPFFSRKKKLVLYLIAINLLSVIPPLLAGRLHLPDMLRSSIIGLQVSFIGVAMYLLYDWYDKKQQAKMLRRQNLKSELALLKNQVSPHFLFNTLNNIDSLIKTNPDKASHTLLELSGMMRYMIYDTNADKVPLSKELEYVENYIELQKLQFSNADLVSYTIKGNPVDISMAPMIFIAFVENAFKHCTNKEERGAIRISFDMSRENLIRFSAINIVNNKHTISKDGSSGVGLEIVKRRLELIYPQKHSLVIERENDLFCVFLTIEI